MCQYLQREGVDRVDAVVWEGIKNRVRDMAKHHSRMEALKHASQKHILLCNLKSFIRAEESSPGS